MAWTTPENWASGETVTASKMNTHVRDNLKYLKGSAGEVAIDDNIKLAAAKQLNFNALGLAPFTEGTTTQYRIEVAAHSEAAISVGAGGSASYNVSFATAFASAPFVFLNVSSATGITASNLTVCAISITVTGFVISLKCNQDTLTAVTVQWVAIGEA